MYQNEKMNQDGQLASVGEASCSSGVVHEVSFGRRAIKINHQS
ncbi:hypothetical protein [Rudanella paleaurantiibacter]|nr:hypothetical protein [Rudanella paleaurantiibacter]